MAYSNLSVSFVGISVLTTLRRTYKQNFTIKMIEKLLLSLGVWGSEAARVWTVRKRNKNGTVLVIVIILAK